MIKIMLAVLILVPQFACADPSHLLPGKYKMIGKAVDSDETYTGKVEISADDLVLKVRREINGQIIMGVASVESALHGEAQVLRIRITQDNSKYEQTCLWQSDLDNYARISCYIYQPGVETREPGMEVMFHDPAVR